MRHCLTLDLKPDSALIAEYEGWHSPAKIPREIIDGLLLVGIKEMEIYRWSNRLFMIIETEIDFDWDAQMKKLAELPGQAEWEQLMDNYQLRLTEGNNKWIKMESLFKLADCI